MDDIEAVSTMFTCSKCLRFFSADYISKHIAAEIENNIANVKCPEPSCDAVLKPNMFAPFVPKRVLDCWRDELMTMQLAKENNWKKCPNCKVYVEKIQGCSHINCVCGSQFCHSCGAHWTNNHACPG